MLSQYLQICLFIAVDGFKTTILLSLCIIAFEEVQYLFNPFISFDEKMKLDLDYIFSFIILIDREIPKDE